MNVIASLPQTRRGHDSMWVVVNQLRKPVQFIPTKAKEIAHEITDQFVDELM